MQIAVFAAIGQSGIFTLQVGTPPPPPTSLVRASDTWRYHKGTNSPTSGWQTNADATLDSTWATGAGGFGFAADNPNETVQCQTMLSDMYNLYSTFYMRRTLTITVAPNSTQRLLLTMDWDDGFVAYLDGIEVARFNAPGDVGIEPASSAIATNSHESSRGNPENEPQPPMTFDLGTVGNRLPPGPHVLAVLGLNRATNSTDFILIADLVLTGGDVATAQDGYFALVKTNAVVLSGSNTFPNSTRVTVNGVNADFNLANETWSRIHPLEPNMNRLFIAALDPQGHILASTNKDVVSEMSSVPLGGTIVGNTGINASNFVIRLTTNVVIAPDAKLNIGENSVVLIPPNTSIRVQTNGELRTWGLPGRPVYFLPADGVTSWRELSATGSNASLTLLHAEIVAGQVRPLAGSSALLQDCVVRDLTNLPAREVIAAVNAASLTLRRTHFFRFAEVDSRDTPFLAEDCLLERMFVDGFDIKSTNAPLVVRRTTIRYGAVLSGEQDADGVDLGPGNAPEVEN